MIFLLWFVCCFFMLTCAILLWDWWLSTAIDCDEGRVGVKSISVREAWLKSGEECTSSGSNVSSYGRDASRKYETLRTGADDSGEDFQNRGTFIVVRSSVFAISSALSSPLARDAYNALWNGRRAGQEQKSSLVLQKFGDGSEPMSTTKKSAIHRRRFMFVFSTGELQINCESLNSLHPKSDFDIYLASYLSYFQRITTLS